MDACKMRRGCIRRLSAVPGLLCVLTAACDGGRLGTVASPLPSGTPVAVEPVPHFSLGVVSGDTLQEFHRVVTPFLLDDGRLVVPLAGVRAIRVFAPNGEYVRSLGRPGEGPGEFQSLYGAWPRGDTIEALDNRLRRITRFLPDGSTEIVQLEGGAIDPPMVAGPVADGWVVGVMTFAGAGLRDPIIVHRFARDGAHLGEVVRAAGWHRTAARGYPPEPLSPTALLGIHDGRIFVADSLEPVIGILNPTGTVEREVSWETGSSSSIAQSFRAVVDSAISRAPPAQAAVSGERLQAAQPPDRLSVFWKFLIDDEGFFWIRPYEPLRHAAALGGLGLVSGGPGGAWTILSPDGAWLGTIEIPESIELVFVSTGAIIGLSRDELGVESVHVYRVQRQT